MHVYIKCIWCVYWNQRWWKQWVMDVGLLCNASLMWPVFQRACNMILFCCTKTCLWITLSINECVYEWSECVSVFWRVKIVSYSKSKSLLCKGENSLIVMPLISYPNIRIFVQYFFLECIIRHKNLCHINTDCGWSAVLTPNGNSQVWERGISWKYFK